MSLYPMQKADLNTLISTTELMSKTFGISKIQSCLKIGYNRACHLVEAGIDEGVLIRDVDQKHLLRLSNSDSWQLNTGVKPNLVFVSVRFDNCGSPDSALSEKQLKAIHVDELDWRLDQGGAEPTHFKPSMNNCE